MRVITKRPQQVSVAYSDFVQQVIAAVAELAGGAENFICKKFQKEAECTLRINLVTNSGPELLLKVSAPDGRYEFSVSSQRAKPEDLGRALMARLRDASFCAEINAPKCRLTATGVPRKTPPRHRRAPLLFGRMSRTHPSLK